MPEYEDIKTADGTEVPVVPLDVTIGGTGSVLTGGRFTDEEFNKALKPFKARGSQSDHGIYDKMRRTDATVNGVLLSQELPIRAAEWIVEPPENPTDQERHIADLVADNLFHRIEGGWDGFLSQAMLFLQYGFMLFERVYERTPSGFHRLRKLAPRMPWSVWKWVEDERGTLVAITQRAKLGSRWENIVIPATKTLLLINRLEGGSWEGISAIRQAYGPWLKKDEIDRRDLINYERFGSGLPVFEEPPNFNPNDPQWKADLDRVAEIGRNLRAHQKSYVQVPRGWTFDVKFPTGSGLPVGEKQKYYDHQILLNSLAMLMDLGHTETGSRALGETFADLFLHALRGHARVVEAALNGVNGLAFTGVVPQMVDLNFGQQRRYPKVIATKLSSKAVVSQLPGLSKAVEGGLLAWGGRDEEVLRDWLDLPSTPHEVESARPGDLESRPNSEDPGLTLVDGGKKKSAEDSVALAPAKYDHINFKPPAGVVEAAKRSLKRRAEKPPSQRGMTPVGLARARDLSNGSKVSPRTARRMLSYFQRHEVDKKGSSWDEYGPGRQAWDGWGGDAGFAWARKLVKQMDAADEGSSKNTTFIDVDGREYTARRAPDGMAERVVAWAQIDDDLTDARKGLGPLLAPIVDRSVEEYKAAADPIIQAMRDGVDIEENTERLVAMTLPNRDEIHEAIGGHIRSVMETGFLHVFRELESQGANESTTAADPIILPSGMTEEELAQKFANLHSKGSAKALVSSQQTVATNKVVDRMQGNLGGLSTQDALTGSSWVQKYQPPEATGTAYSGVAGDYTSAAFNAGREEGAKAWEAERKGFIQMVRFTSLMDSAACEPCMLEDGKRWAMTDSAYDTSKPPFHLCKGWSSCRCMYIYEKAGSSAPLQPQPALPEGPAVPAPKERKAIELPAFKKLNRDDIPAGWKTVDPRSRAANQAGVQGFRDTGGSVRLAEVIHPMLEGEGPRAELLKQQLGLLLEATSFNPSRHDIASVASKQGKLSLQNSLQKVLSKWNSTSANEDVLALAMQDIADKKWGVGDKFIKSRVARDRKAWIKNNMDPWEDDKFAWGTNKKLIGRMNEIPEGTAELQRRMLVDECGEFLEEILNVMYDETQDALKAAGVDEIVMYRGTSLPPSMVPNVTTHRADLQPMSSFSTRYQVADTFSENRHEGGELTAWATMSVAKVPRERILSMPKTGYGVVGENEFVVIGGQNLEAFTVRATDPSTYADAVESRDALAILLKKSGKY